jgi:hypothetical protein
MILFFISSAFAQESYCFDDGFLYTVKEEQSSFISGKLKKERKKINESKRKYVWQKRGKYQLPKYEKLIYNVLWNFVPAGDAVLELKGFNNIDSRKAHHIYLYFSTKSFFDSFYALKGTGESWFDDESKSSLKFRSNIYQGSQTKYEQLDFYPIEKTYLLNDNGILQKGNTKKYEEDVLTALYYIRIIPLKIGGKYALDVHSGNLSWSLTVKVLRKEKIKINLGEFNCFVIEPVIDKDLDLINSTYKMIMWLTDDKKRIPICFKAETPVGSINAVLESVCANRAKELGAK